MTRERMREIALKYWHLKLRDPNFAKERAKIRRNSARIAGQLGMTSAEFKGFFVMCDFTSTNQLTHDELTGEIGEIALRFTEHRITEADNIKINNALRRCVMDAATYIGESPKDCLGFMRILLIAKINKHLS